MSGKLKRGLTLRAFLKQAGPGRSIRVYRDKEVIYSQGSPANAVFYLQSGIVELRIVTKLRSKKAMLTVLQEGDLFGEGCLGTQLRRMSTATSIGSSTITRLERGSFRRQIHQDPVFAAMVITFLLSRIVRFQEDLEDHFLNSSEKRLARILLMQRRFGRKSKSEHMILQFSQTTLSEMVGTTRARICHFMNKFRKKGYIQYKGGFINGSLQINSDRLTVFLQG